MSHFKSSYRNLGNVSRCVVLPFYGTDSDAEDASKISSRACNKYANVTWNVKATDQNPKDSVMQLCIEQLGDEFGITHTI